ncbi:caspase-1-like isoform X1 [Hyaena hyaena]|uniref:caspase-1-like isoform X1 n=1 Tax=Hyaena hyaena TaxID=95912 RepID=UPI001922DA08|nr:caspase-1-like isoform X1 [Hyaena hyaena]
MADKVLKSKRKQFINSVGMGTLSGLLDELFQNSVLNQEEMERVKCENATVMDKARALIDAVLRKGPRACQLVISHICEEDTHLAETLELCSSSRSGNSLTDSAAAVSPLPEDKHDKNPLKTLESVGKELLTDFLQGLVEKDVLKLEEAEKKKFHDAKAGDKPWVLLHLVREKRKEAGQAFVQTFVNTDKRSTSVEAFGEITPGPAEPEESTDTLKLCPQEEFMKLYKQKAGEIYPIKERKDRTRLALIICNTKFDHIPNRNGAEFDIKGMRRLLTDLGYSVHLEEELDAKEMESALRAFAARPEHKSSDSTFLVFMSHGILSGICGTKHSPENPDVLAYDTIFQIFNNRHCLSLKDKPKVIIVQACRGENLGELLVSDSPAAPTERISQMGSILSQIGDSLEDDAIHRVHVEKDFIAFCSSTPHNVSWRDVNKGSLFITQLITCFQKYSWCCHLEEVFRKVQQSFEKPNVRAQMPTIERLSMTRYFYLFPGN